MRYAVMVAQHGNFRHAAEHLYVSQSALSQQIKKLEEELGEKIFERHASGVALTRPGRRFVEKAQGVLERAEEAKSSVQDPDQKLSGELTVGWLPTLTTECLLEFTKDFSETDHNVSLTIREGQPEYLLNQLTLGNVDYLVLSGPIDQSNHAVQELGQEAFNVVVPAGWDVGSTDVIDDLSDQPFLMLKEGHSYRKGTFDVETDAPMVSYWGNNLHELKRWVANGVGFSLFPELFADSMGSEAVERRMIPDPPTRDLLLVQRESAYQDELGRWFTDHLKNWFEETL